MYGRDTCVEQGEDGERRIPDGGLTRLRPQTVALVDREALPTVDRSPQRLVLEAVPERGQHDDRPHPGWLNPTPRAVGLLAVAHPALGRRSSQIAQVPSSRCRASSSFAILRSSSGVRRPRKWCQNRCWAIMVAFDSSSPTHQPSGCWSSSSRSVARSTAPSSVVAILSGAIVTLPP